MKPPTIHLQRIAALLTIAVIVIWVFIIAKPLLNPFVFAILLSLMIKPVVNFWERFVRSRITALVLAFLVIVVPLTGISYFICWQSIDIFSDMPSLTDKVEKGLDETFRWMDKKFHLKRGESEDIVRESIEEIQSTGNAGKETRTNGNGKVIGQGIKVSSAFLTGFFLTLIYTFLLLLYRQAIKKFFLVQFGPKTREHAGSYLLDIQRVTKDYLYGIGIVILIVGSLNSLGLWIIGVDYALFFGFLAACLAIIPYVGTTIGGVLPVAYAIATTSEWWQPVAVILLFVLVQILEGNFITPKIAGGTVKLNPLASIFFLFAGGMIWGVTGMVLALPLLAILKTTFSYIPFLKPVSLLLSSDLYDKDSLFDEKFDDKNYRLWTFFSRKNE